MKLLRNFDNDDDFFHVTCHVEDSIKVKIQNGEFIDLSKLLPGKRSDFTGTGDSETLELVAPDGHTYFTPAKYRENRVTGIKTWDQAFRIYAASTLKQIRVGLQKSGSMYM